MEVNIVRAKWVLAVTGTLLNDGVSMMVFSVLDILDAVLCHFFRAADFMMEGESKPCYCSTAREAITVSNGKILVTEAEETTKVVRLTCSELQMEEISDTLFTRPSILSKIPKSAIAGSPEGFISRRARPTYTVDPTIVGMLQERIVGKEKKIPPSRRWSDCDCDTCTGWASSSKKTLFVKAEGATDNVQEDVLFIHGFISSSGFWTETLYPNFSAAARSKYRFLAVDLLGFGRSPKPADCLYTLRDHLEMIEKSVLDAYDVKSFHLVAHSLGCILALALAAEHGGSVKSLTLLAPPYFPAPRGEPATQYMMRKMAPRRVCPIISFGSSIVCSYEHISRAVCVVASRNHRLWEFLAKLLTRNRMITYLIEGFCTHTHNSAWHTLHNILLGTAGKMEGYLEEVKNRMNYEITVLHGKDDELIPVECSHNLQDRIPRVHLKVIENKDHITIVVGRQKAFARELEEIWKNATTKLSSDY